MEGTVGNSMITKIDIDNDVVVGRLGNKLFQIATGYSIAKEMNDEFAIPAWKYAHVFPNVKMKQLVGFNKIWTEPSFTYSKPLIEHFSGTVQLNGYFQSDKYFSSREDIVKLFEFSTYVKSMACMYEQTNNLHISDYTAIHVRRGDYTNLTHYYADLASTEYYRNAIQLLGEKKFVVFSDDIGFCSQYFSQFQGYDFHYVAGNNDHVDLCLMSNCKNNIIANSSFSWWGAYLNRKTGKVVMPKDWFVCGLDSKDLYVDGWNKV